MISFGKYTENMSIQHPRDKGKTIYSLNLRNKSVATSGDYNQYYDGNFDKSHILNSKNIISVTVIHKSLAHADVLATAIFVSGSKNLKRFSKEKYLIITKDLRIIKSKGFP
jgi:thiamine biosynthesis lipoprotein ApbE